MNVQLLFTRWRFMISHKYYLTKKKIMKKFVKLCLHTVQPSFPFDEISFQYKFKTPNFSTSSVKFKVTLKLKLILPYCFSISSIYLCFFYLLSKGKMQAAMFLKLQHFISFERVVGGRQRVGSAFCLFDPPAFSPVL